MPVNWKDPDAFTRLLAAVVAAHDLKLDYRKIASMYGNGATYDSIEGRFRIIKREAATLKTEIDSGSRAEAPARGATSVNTTPRKPKTTVSPPKKDKIITGRVGKSNGTPSKKRTSAMKGFKKEPESSSSSIVGIEDDEVVEAEVENGHNRVDGSLYYDGAHDDDGMDFGAF